MQKARCVQAAADKPPALDALTSLRFFAALLVVIYHYWQPDRFGPRPFVVDTGHLGVTFFFVLSGFILSYNYDAGGSFPKKGLTSFYLARFARIYPLYLATLVLVLPLLVPLAGRPLADSHDLQVWAIASPVLLQSWFPGAACFLNCPSWSISTEAFFYLVFPFALPLVLWRPRLAFVIIIAAMVAIWITTTTYWLHRVGPLDAMRAATVDRSAAGYRLMELYLYFPPLRLPEFLIGIALYGLWTRGADAWPVAKLWLAAISGAAFVYATARWLPENVLRTGWAIIAIAPLILAAANDRRGLLTRGLFIRLGQISFALYLVHVPVASWLAAIDRQLLGSALSANPLALAMLAMSTSFAAAALLFHLIEEPARRAIRRMAAGGV